MWGKEKLLIMCKFSFSHCVFKRLVLQTCKNQGLFGKSVNSATNTKLNQYYTITAGNHVTQQQQQWQIFEKNPWLQVRKSSIIPLINDRLEFGLKQRRWKDSRDLLDVLDFLNNTWSKSCWRANKFFTLDNCLLVNNFFIRCCLKNLTHQANPRSPSAFSASNQIPIGHVLTELLKIFLPEVGGFFQMSVIVVVVVSRDSPLWQCRLNNCNKKSLLKTQSNMEKCWNLIELLKIGFLPTSIDWLNGFWCHFQQYLCRITATVHIFMHFLGFTSTWLLPWSILPQDTPAKNPVGLVKLEPRTSRSWVSHLTTRPCWNPYLHWRQLLQITKQNVSEWTLSLDGWETLLEKEKILVITIISSVFKNVSESLTGSGL